MKKSIIIAALTVFFFGSVSAQQDVIIDIERSSIKWQGSHLFNFGKHYGTVELKEGHFLKADGQITQGHFTIDMNTIGNTEGNFSSDLVDHLKNEDFFDVTRYPTSTIEITNVTYEDPQQLTLTADLTIKGMTHPIQFQANQDDESKEIHAHFIIDRSLWDIKYGSRSIVDVADHVISDAIEFEVTLIFK